MKTSTLLKFSFWKVVGVIIIAAGVYSTFIRFTQGLGASTNLSDAFPWGLWIGFDILCGVGLAAGGFTICAMTHIFNIERFKPLTRPAILTAFLGYLLVIFALMFDIGRPYNIWNAIIHWNIHSVMFEVAMCVMLYSTVLFLEFSPVILERYKLYKLLKIVKKVLIPVMILGVLLSTLHQSSLGSLFLIVPTKMHPLWYSPMLPVYFFLSAVAIGFSMVIFESYLSARAFNHGLKMNLLSEAGRIIMVLLIVNFIAKISDFAYNGKLGYLLGTGTETNLFYLEILMGTIVPVAMLANKQIRESRKWLYVSSIFVLSGFLLNRINVSITSIAWSAEESYFPSLTEISITMMIVVLGMWAFKLVVENFPVFGKLSLKEEQALHSAKLKSEPEPITIK